MAQEINIDWEVIGRSHVFPHRLSFCGEDGARFWNIFIGKPDIRYSALETTKALDETLNIVGEYQKQFNVVEIGAGNGRHISSVCDGFRRIGELESYTLVDISDILLEQAYEELKKKAEEDSVIKIDKLLLDCSEPKNQKELEELVKDKIVILSNNSTIFTDDGFTLIPFRTARYMLVTLERYETNTSFRSQLNAAELLTHLLFKRGKMPREMDDAMYYSSYAENYLNVFFKCNDFDKNYPGLLKNELTDINDLRVLSSLKFASEGKLMEFFNSNGFDIVGLKSSDVFYSVVLQPK